jgi:putative transposase
MTTGDREVSPLAGLSAEQRAAAMERFAVLRPVLEDEVPVARAAAAAGVAARTLHRWLAAYRRAGLPGLARRPRADRGERRIAPEIVALIEGLALRRPRPSVAAIHRRVRAAATKHGLAVPSLGSVHAIVGALDPGMVTLALEGPAAYRDRFELIHRHRAERPNATWQADHTPLDVLVLDANARPVRPWLTTVIDDHSRAIAGYTVFLGAPSAMQTALALRQAI